MIMIKMAACSSTNEDGAVTKYEYDGNGNILSVEDAYENKTVI